LNYKIKAQKGQRRNKMTLTAVSHPKHESFLELLIKQEEKAVREAIVEGHKDPVKMKEKNNFCILKVPMEQNTGGSSRSLPALPILTLMVGRK